MPSADEKVEPTSTEADEVAEATEAAEVSSDDVGGEAPCFAHLFEDARDVRP